MESDLSRLSASESVAKLESNLRNIKEEVNVIIAGKVQSGKTELFNGLCGVHITEDPSNKQINCHFFEDHEVKVWDTCSLYKDSAKNAISMKKINGMKCMRKDSKKILLYTIPINQTRFIQNIETNADINCLHKFTAEFGVEIWEHALIVFTFANNQYEAVKDDLEGNSEEEMQLSFYSQEISDMESIIRECLQMVNIPDEIATAVPIVLAGYVRHETAPSQLPCDGAGKSWVWNMWQEIVKISPDSTKHQLLEICFQKIIGDPFMYADSYLTFVKLQGSIYSNQAYKARPEGSAEDEEVFTKLGLSYSYLRLLKGWFDNYDKVTTKYLRCSPESSAKMRAWYSLKNEISIIVSGEEQSGKTTLINNMISSKLKEKEFHLKVGQWTSSYKSIKFTITEVAPKSLQVASVLKAAVVIVCVNLSATKEMMKRVLEPILYKQPKNMAVVLTFADNYTTSKSWTEVIRTQSQQVRDVLEEMQPSECVLEHLHIVPAGYQLTIRDDPTNKSWVMDVWLNCIASANSSHQSALVIFLNHFIYGGKKVQVQSRHKEIFREQFLDLLLKMIEVHSIEY